MTRIFAGFAIVLLCGCATPNQMREGASAAEFSSTKAAKTVALCVVRRWENSGFGGTPSVMFRPTETGFMVAVRNETVGSTQLLADIDESPTGSRTRYFKGSVLGEGAFDTAIRDCQ